MGETTGKKTIFKISEGRVIITSDEKNIGIEYRDNEGKLKGCSAHEKKDSKNIIETCLGTRVVTDLKTGEVYEGNGFPWDILTSGDQKKVRGYVMANYKKAQVV